MRHGYFGKKLSRTKNERRLLFRNLVRDLIKHGQIKTTITKAKAIQPLAERLVTKAKDGSEQKRREVLSVITDKALTNELFAMAKTRFASRQSGFTRIVRVGRRGGDNTEEAVFMFVDPAVKEVEQKSPKTKTAASSKTTKKSTKTTKAAEPAKKKDAKSTPTKKRAKTRKAEK